MEAKLTVTEKGNICCPKCGKPTKTRVKPETVLRDFPLWCQWCKKEYSVNK